MWRNDTGLYFVTFHLYTQRVTERRRLLSQLLLSEILQVLYLAAKTTSRLTATTPGYNHRQPRKFAHSRSLAHAHKHTQRHECALQRTYALISSFWWEDNCGTRHSHCQNRHNRQTDGEAHRQTDRQPPPPVEKHLRRYEPHFPRAPQTHINKIFSCNKTQTRLVCGEGLRMYWAAIQCVSFCQLRE